MCCGMLTRCMFRLSETTACMTRYGKLLLFSYLSGMIYSEAPHASFALTRIGLQQR